MYVCIYVCMCVYMRNVDNSIDAQLNEYYYPRE